MSERRASLETDNAGADPLPPPGKAAMASEDDRRHEAILAEVLATARWEGRTRNMGDPSRRRRSTSTGSIEGLAAAGVGGVHSTAKPGKPGEGRGPGSGVLSKKARVRRLGEPSNSREDSEPSTEALPEGQERAEFSLLRALRQGVPRRHPGSTRTSWREPTRAHRVSMASPSSTSSPVRAWRCSWRSSRRS